MGRMTTHVLDTSRGIPGRGIAVALYRLDPASLHGGGRKLVKNATTNQDGRCDAPLLDGAEFVAGFYELDFEIGAYFANAAPDPRIAAIKGFIKNGGEGMLRVGGKAIAENIMQIVEQTEGKTKKIPFLDRVTLRFGIDDAAGHYHVPLVVTPWSYSTYRGS